MAETTERLLDAAERRMRRAGYNAVSFRDLADDTEIKSASVHYHYRHKEDLGVALIERYHDRFFADLEAAASKAKTCREKLEAFCHVYKQALTDEAIVCLCGMLGAESSGLPESLRVAVVRFFEANIAWVSAALPPGIPDEDRQAKATQILASLQGAMMLATSMRNAELFDGLAQRLLDESLAGA